MIEGQTLTEALEIYNTSYTEQSVEQTEESDKTLVANFVANDDIVNNKHNKPNAPVKFQSWGGFWYLCGK